MSGPTIFGILNITEDSFSDGGRHLDPASALAAARRLVADGADVVDLGAAASNVDATPVAPETEIRRLAPVIAALKAAGAAVSVDSFAPETQRFALTQQVDYLNDVQGFPVPSLYPALAAARCRLVVMHAVQGRARAQRDPVPTRDIWRRIEDFFGARLAAFDAAGITRDRLILDPGMGFFLGGEAEASFVVLAALDRLKRRFGLPVLISVSRKSFLAAITGAQEPAARGAATLAAELFAAENGADYIRTHDPRALKDGLAVMAALRTARPTGLRPYTPRNSARRGR
ncbi:MAG TPA: dihydropteroate synthase [Stellaceae bacterium]|jgi:dihydropteroate synthase type 2|nr:dihydropteroate synthase [Stellaceae bacterium]